MLAYTIRPAIIAGRTQVRESPHLRRSCDGSKIILVRLIRLLLAGIAVYVTMALVGVGLIQLIPTLHPAVAGISAAVAGVIVGALALRLFNSPQTHPLGLKSIEQQIADLEAKGLVRHDAFVARRAFQVEEFEDEGSHYFIELEDGSVLFLSGQYLYEHEADFAGRRHFPCSQFEVRRHRHEGYALDIVCDGKVIEPEVLAPPFREDDDREQRIRKDGQIIRDKTYEHIRDDRLATSTYVRRRPTSR